MGARQSFYGFIVFVLVIVAGGYATAWASRDACIDEAWRELAPQHIVGHRLGGTNQPLSRRDIEARVAGPFRVEVSYLVPNGLEGTLYVRNYRALPWKRSLRGQAAHRIEAL
jgi:hypothetical protein